MRYPKEAPPIPLLTRMASELKSTAAKVKPYMTTGRIYSTATVLGICGAFYLMYIMPLRNQEYYAKKQDQMVKSLRVSREQIAADQHLPLWRNPYEK